MVTMIREAIDDIRRRQRDKEVNQQKYEKMTALGGQRTVTSANIRVGDLIFVEKVVILSLAEFWGGYSFFVIIF